MCGCSRRSPDRSRRRGSSSHPLRRCVVADPHGPCPNCQQEQRQKPSDQFRDTIHTEPRTPNRLLRPGNPTAAEPDPQFETTQAPYQSPTCPPFYQPTKNRSWRARGAGESQQRRWEAYLRRLASPQAGGDGEHAGSHGTRAERGRGLGLGWL
jgi:hypothetical protein